MVDQEQEGLLELREIHEDDGQGSGQDRCG